MRRKTALVILLINVLFISEAQIGFLPLEEYETKISSNFMEAYDLDLDGKPDFILASQYDFITIMNSSRSYVPLNFNVGNSAVERGLAVADLDENGFPDIVVTEYESNQISILFAIDEYSYNDPVFVNTGTGPVDAFAVDYDEDGDIDILVANKDSDNVSFLENDGKGDLSSSFSISVQSAPTTVVLQKIDNDSFYDLVVTNKTSNSVSIATGSGIGTFNSVQNTTVEDAPIELQIADIDDDSYRDIIISHENSNYMTILYGRSDNGFDEATIYSETKTNSGLFAVTDINDDELLDIVINSNDVFGGESLFILNNEERDYSVTTNNTGNNRRQDVVAAELVDQENAHFIISTYSYSEVFIPAKNSSGVFDRYWEYHSAPSPFNIASGDLNNDGFPDIVSTNYSSQFITIYYYDGDGNFENPVNLYTGSSLGDIDVADIDSDGYPDIILSGSLDVLIFYGNEDYNYEEFELYDSFSSRDVVIVDINLDGNLDIASRTAVYLGDGNRHFQQSYGGISANFREDLAVLDINNDGFMDRVIPYILNDVVEIYLGNGSTFASPITLPLENPDKVAVGYFNDDEYVDLVVSNFDQDEGEFVITNGYLSFIYGDESDDFQLENVIETGYTSFIEVSDLNNDAIDEIAIRGGGGTRIYIGETDGTFSQTQNVSFSGHTPEDVAFSDIDGNGILDLIASDRITNGSKDVIRLVRTDGAAPIINSDQTFSASEDITVHTEIGAVTASNVADQEDLTNWKIIAGNMKGDFDIDSETGVLSINANNDLDFESSKNYQLDIQVSDGTTQSRRESITIDILDANDNAPFIEDDQEFSIDENSAEDTSVGFVEAEDLDTNTEFSDWEISNGNDNNVFDIDSETGEISVANSEGLDYESNTSFILSIQVSDGVNTSLETDILIRVNDLDDNPLSNNEITDLIVFPNPTSGLVTVKNVLQIERTTYSLVDIQGKVLVEKRPIDPSGVIDLGNLNKGSYTLILFEMKENKEFRILYK